MRPEPSLGCCGSSNSATVFIALCLAGSALTQLVFFVCAVDLTELSLPSNIQINFPEGKEKPMHFEISIKPDEGYYRNGKFLFDFQISTGYPYDAPKVKCKTKVRVETPATAAVQHGEHSYHQQQGGLAVSSWHSATAAHTSASHQSVAWQQQQ